VRVWDVATGALERTLDADPHGVSTVAFSPDGRRAISGGVDTTVKLWDVATGALLRTLKGHKNHVKSVAFSPDGRRVLSGSEDGTLKLWDAATGKLLRTFEGHSEAVNSVAFSPNGQQLLSGGQDLTVRLWDAATGVPVHTFKGHSEWVRAVAFSPDGRQVLSGDHDKNIKSWNAATGAPIGALGEHSQWIASVVFSPDNRQLVTGRDDGAFALWDAASGTLVRTVQGHAKRVSSLAFSPDGRTLLSGSNDGTVKLWNVATGALVRTLHASSNWITAVAFSPDGRQLLAAGWDPTARLWDAETGELVRTFEVGSGVLSAVFSPDGGRLLLGCMDHTVKFWDVATGTLMRSVKEHGHWVTSIAFSPDGRRVLSGSWDNTVKLWDAATMAPTRTFEVNSWVRSVTFSPDSRWALSGSDDTTVRLWDAAAGAQRHTLAGHSSIVASVAFSPDGRLVASGSWDTTTRIWKTETGELLVTLFGSSRGEWLALTPEGFFNASSPGAASLLGIVRGLDAYGIDQLWQSLYAPDLVREKLAGDPSGEVVKAAAVTSLEKVLDSGKAPRVAIVSPATGEISGEEIVTAEAAIAAQADGGIGRVEWRVNGVTVGVSNPAPGADGMLSVSQLLALDAGENTIEVVAYNGRNLVASAPAQTKVTWQGTPASKPRLYLLAIGINRYVDQGGIGGPGAKAFPPLALAETDALALAGALQRAGQALYGDVRVRTALNEEATADSLDAIVTEMAAEIGPRDTFVLFAAAHGYSHQGRFYLIPQDHQGGTAPEALAAHAIDQQRLQDWLANRIKARRALILLDACESGALTSGHIRSRFEGAGSDAAIGRLHEAIGRPVLTAAGVGQSALEITDLGHGVFTSAVIDSFRKGDTNDDGKVSLSELVAHVQDLVPKLIKDPKVRAEVARRGPVGGVQSARFGGRGEDFDFVHRIR
jgi:WD40 repeat protein